MELDNKKAPKSVIVLIVFVILIGLTTIIPAKWLGIDPRKNLQPKLNLDLNVLPSPSEIAKDLDNDGKISWKEIINNDTNISSSTLSELKNNSIDKKSIAELNDPNNLTSSFTKNSYMASLYLEKNGITDEASKEKVLTTLLQQEAEKMVPTTYYYKDINIAKTETKDTIKAYGNNLISIIQNSINEKTIKQDIVNIFSYLDKEDPSFLEPIKTNRDKLDIVIQKLLKLSTPPSAINYQILTINRITAYRDMINDFTKADSDPLRTSIASNTYKDKILMLFGLRDMFSEYFNKQNIVFSAKEPGYIFTSGYTK